MDIGVSKGNHFLVDMFAISIFINKIPIIGIQRQPQCRGGDLSNACASGEKWIYIYFNIITVMSANLQMHISVFLGKRPVYRLFLLIPVISCKKL